LKYGIAHHGSRNGSKIAALQDSFVAAMMMPILLVSAQSPGDTEPKKAFVKLMPRINQLLSKSHLFRRLGSAHRAGKYAKMNDSGMLKAISRPV